MTYVVTTREGGKNFDTYELAHAYLLNLGYIKTGVAAPEGDAEFYVDMFYLPYGVYRLEDAEVVGIDIHEFIMDNPQAVVKIERRRLV